MNSEQISKVELSIKNLKEKKSKIFFIVQDTKGNAKASISYIYNLAMSLHKSGLNPIMLHEKPDYTSVSGWLGEEYMSLPHRSIEGQNLEIAPEDFLVVPELYGFVLPQVANLPCGKIVLTQAYDHVFETLQPGQTWNQFGFLKCITTSEFQKEHLSNIMRNISYDILPTFISDEFKKQVLPPKPIIAIHTRDQRDTANIIKSFYLKFPQYRWVSFRDMRGQTEKDFAKNLQDCFLSVWVDETSGFGTFPLESMKTGVPVLGLVPNLLPHWMSEHNGFWINNKLQTVDFIADILQNWLEDNLKPELFAEMENTVKSLSTKEDFEKNSVSLFEGYLLTRQQSFEEQLNKIAETETIE
jgi:cytoplasmic iron level regulating protein YaaA (DUF328/UPF0246 family)